MNRRTCLSCGGRSYSSYSGTNWDCPYCGEDLGDVQNELSDMLRDPLEEYEQAIEGFDEKH
ncbi:hypothetical protein [Desulfosporosinus sp. OT]|uniref:hypothetical protein n=1 Tax=Desulfosporosinus sp. OT TaxID=913865 RepID=UPI000223A490|nr:hypothetical protein [Desulfosporosinus sp. OT]EGW37837.1 hypothetical protein DOT_4245 [Desulfosporosinus sp. OT]